MKSLQLIRGFGDRRWESHVWHEVANAHMKLNTKEDTDKALQAIQTSLKVFQKVRDTKGEGNLYHSLSQVFIRKEKYKEALQAAQKERSCYKRTKEERLEGSALMNIYQIHVCRKKPAQAVKAAN